MVAQDPGKLLFPALKPLVTATSESVFFLWQTMFGVIAECPQERPAHYTMVTHIPRSGVRGLAKLGLVLWNTAFLVLGVHRRHLYEYSLLLSTRGWLEIEVLGGVAAADHKGQSYV